VGALSGTVPSGQDPKEASVQAPANRIIELVESYTPLTIIVLPNAGVIDGNLRKLAGQVTEYAVELFWTISHQYALPPWAPVKVEDVTEAVNCPTLNPVQRAESESV
jgi:hypothetical protein